jgi:hypothetical protein
VLLLFVEEAVSRERRTTNHEATEQSAVSNGPRLPSLQPAFPEPDRTVGPFVTLGGDVSSRRVPA